MIASLLLTAALFLTPGHYATEDRRVSARVESDGGTVRLFVVAAGLPRGGATAADCALMFEGKDRSRRLTAVPFVDGVHDMDEGDLGAHAPVAVLRPARNGFRLRVLGELPCGVGSSLDGRLFRMRSPGRAEGDASSRGR